ncbi:hypothetical protein LTR08_005523 [Meristemomyces frigidus]|nr:hypothetical protein LTR08_005523 [Meristemomyces frigidus]
MASRAQTWNAFRSIVRRHLTTTQPPRSFPRAAGLLLGDRVIPRRNALDRPFSSSRALLRDESAATSTKRKAARTQASSNSLRRVAVEAQRSRQVIKGRGRKAYVDPDIETKDVTAYCAAETYNLHIARHLLRQRGYEPDPLHTDLFPQVLHIQTPSLVGKDNDTGKGKLQGVGDIFIFPSGSAVTWNVSEKLALSIVERILPEAAGNSHIDKMEIEDMAYVEDADREHSKILGDTIILGTKSSSSINSSGTPNHPLPTSLDHASEVENALPEQFQPPDLATTLAKIAISSALARSTKLAVLENMLNAYFATTRTIPTTLSTGSRLPFSRAFILQKTGELLSLRAQLNLYSELTDSLPDLFWDYRIEMGLESYYEQVGRALDVGVRIKVLNERMDYASEIAAVLRERLSEKHSTELEWLIIGLISIEVGFEIARLWREREESGDSESTEALMREWLRRELGKT